MSLEAAIEHYCKCLEKQAELMERKQVKRANACALESYNALAEIFNHGDIGLAAIARLFEHECRNVRISAAACMLRYRPAKARQVLLQESQMPGLDSVTAEWALKRWDEEGYCLDPSDRSLFSGEADS